MTWRHIAGFQFGDPWWLLLLPLLAWWFWKLGKMGRSPAITHSSIGILAKLGKQPISSPGRILKGLLITALTLLILAMARPQLPYGEQKDPNKGIDIMLVCDVSGSMDSRDFSIGGKKITRREALLKAISEFVDNRKNDRVGMVGFAKETYLLSPMTTDGNWIKEVFRMVRLQGGTAIGDGIITGVDKLAANSNRSKVIILVTDGQNNSGVNPMEAGEIARKQGIRIYALEIMDAVRLQGSVASNSPLAKIATSTGGQYFQASDTEALTNIYRQIDRMEKHEFETNRSVLYHELFPWLTGAGFAILLFGAIATRTVWMRLP